MPNNIEHELMRFRTMSIKQLYTRLNKITDRQKLLNFIHCCSEKEMNKETPNYYINMYHALKQVANNRYELLFPENKNYKLNSISSTPSTEHKVAITKTCPICNKPFILQSGVDGDYCSEKCWTLGAYNQWGKKEFGNRKGYVDYSSPPKNSKGYDYLDTTDELIRKIAGVKPKPIKKPEPTKPIDFIDVLPKRKLRLD